MNKVLIKHLSNQDYRGVSYKAISHKLGNRLTNESETSEQLFDFFDTLEYFDGDVIITVLSHGFESRGIAHGTWESFVSWAELLFHVNKIQNSGKLILNLMAICNSQTVSTMANFCNHKIDEIWVTTSETISINKALLAEEAKDFFVFLSQLEDEEKPLYKKLNCR